MITRQPLPAAPSDRFRRRRFIEAAGERFRHAALAPGIRACLKRAYHAALMMQTGGRGLACRLPHGEVIRALPQYRHLSWNAIEYEAFREAIRPGMVALDVGANVGAYALLLGQWVGSSGAVFAFEPAPEPFAGLVRHVALNHLEQVVQPVQAAVADVPSTASLLLAGTSGESRLATSSDVRTGAIQVAATSIDAFCAERQLTPDFIKIDVEGAELAALRGARETIRRTRGRLALFVEMHPSMWPILGIAKDDMLEELRAQALEPTSLVKGADMWSVEGMSLRLEPR